MTLRQAASECAILGSLLPLTNRRLWTVGAATGGVPLSQHLGLRGWEPLGSHPTGRTRTSLLSTRPSQACWATSKTVGHRPVAASGFGPVAGSVCACPKMCCFCFLHLTGSPIAPCWQVEISVPLGGGRHQASRDLCEGRPSRPHALTP